jgi:hypothetical protein
MTNSIDRNQWLNVTSESRDRIEPFFLNFALGRNRTRGPRVPEPKRTPLGYILPNNVAVKENFQRRFSVNLWCGIFGDRRD